MDWAVRGLGKTWGLKGTPQLCTFVKLLRARDADGATTASWSLELEAQAFVDWVIVEGGILPKACQVLAERPDIVQEKTYRQALSRCQVSCEPVPFKEIQSIISGDGLSAHIEALGGLQEEPLSTGSVGQVHFCGDGHVVKVALSKKKREMQRQFSWLKALVKLPGLQKSILADVQYVAGPIKEHILAEFDLRGEQQRLRLAVAALPRAQALLGEECDFEIRVPQVSDKSTQHVMIMTRERGMLFKDLLDQDSRMLHTIKLMWLRRVLRLWGVFTLGLGWFHSDPHPGNLMISEDNALVLLDWGSVTVLDRNQLEDLRTLFSAFAQRPVEVAVATSCLRRLQLRTKKDTDAGLMQLAVSTLAMDILVCPEVQRSFGEEEDLPKHIPQELAQLIRVVATLEGSASRVGRMRVLPLWLPTLGKAMDCVEDAPLVPGVRNDGSAEVGHRDLRTSKSRWIPSFSRSAGLSDDELRDKFSELDMDESGKLSRQEAEEALRKMGRSHAEIEQELGGWPPEEGVDFLTFRQMAKARRSSWLPNFKTNAEVDAGKAGRTFSKIDTDAFGQLLGREEIADALADYGKSQKQIEDLVAGMPDDQELDFPGFLELLGREPSPASSPSKRSSLWSRVSQRVSALSSLVSPTMSEEQLKAKFEEIDVDQSGKLSRQEVEAALIQLGRSPGEVEHELSRWPLEDGVDFRSFRLMAKHPYARADLGFIGPKDADLRDAFDVIDTDHSGQLMGREEISDALRELGKSQKQISRLVSDLPEDQFLDFEGFQQLVKGKSFASHWPWGSFSDGMTEEQLRAMFSDIDADGNGKLSREEIEQALLQLGRSHAEIDKELRKWPCEDGVDFDTFKLMTKPPKVSWLRDFPGLHSFTDAISDFFGGFSDDELWDAFDKIDVDNSGKLEKCELAQALHDMGKSQSRIDRLLERMPDGQELDFEDFRALVPGLCKQTFLPRRF
ncbi:unnamed protein product [Symbiodinium natans]|uniref:EF-hand domain-containing protein n=1 Tax=Symbiodinium natans TaxID=878477 RepID=A0A812SFN5_9DINO|nr:unnamed protein product [Symbiodinium natans]